MIPFHPATVYPETQPLLETDVPLAANANFPAQVAGTLTYIDVFDMLRVTRTNTGFAGGTIYTRDPDLAEPFYVIEWSLYARAASISASIGPGHCPGLLIFYGGSLDEATGGVNIPLGGLALASFPYPGPPRLAGSLHPPAVTTPLITGYLRARSRMLAVQYRNGAVDQTVFHLGVVVRPW